MGVRHKRRTAAAGLTVALIALGCWPGSSSPLSAAANAPAATPPTEARFRDDRIAALSASPHVRYTEPDYLAEPLLAPNDLDYDDQWRPARPT